jgi:uncharacterized membrane protein YkvA (DUF1232 family)
MTQPMNQNPSPGSLVQVTRTLQLVWRLLLDPRVPILPKLIIPAVIVYVVSPIDLIPDPIPVLGQLDDLGVVFFGIRFFIELCPSDVVMEHRRAIAGEAARGRGDYVDATYRVVNDDEKK